MFPVFRFRVSVFGESVTQLMLCGSLCALSGVMIVIRFHTVNCDHVIALEFAGCPTHHSSTPLSHVRIL